MDILMSRGYLRFLQNGFEALTYRIWKYQSKRGLGVNTKILSSAIKEILTAID